MNKKSKKRRGYIKYLLLCFADFSLFLKMNTSKNKPFIQRNGSMLDTTVAEI